MALMPLARLVSVTVGVRRRRLRQVEVKVQLKSRVLMRLYPLEEVHTASYKCYDLKLKLPGEVRESSRGNLIRFPALGAPLK